MKQSTISFLVTPDEFELLASIVYLEPFLDEVLSKVKVEEGGLRLKFPYEDLEDSLSALAHEVEHENSADRRQQLRTLSEKLEGYKRLRQHVQTHGKAIVKKKTASKVIVYIFEIRMIHYPPAGKQVLRTIAVSGGKNLEHLAETIIESFGFRLDHCFAFYSDIHVHPSSAQKEIYELFADIGQEPTAPHAHGVKKTKISSVFNTAGKTMLFMFDYGEDWRFFVELKQTRPALPGEKLPSLLKKTGKAPLQYPPVNN